MYLLIDGEVWDPDHALIEELAVVVDRHLELLRVEWQASPLPDELGYFDRMEHIAGLGFVACQTYLTSTYGFARVPKKRALLLGPTLTCGRPLAETVNHAANYWKHRDEWDLDSSTTQRDRIAAAFDDIGFPVDGEYPLSGILGTIGAPAESMFGFVVAQLAVWRECVRKEPV